MARTPQSKGICKFCGREMTKGGLTRHLSSCSARKEANASTTGQKEQTLYHLQAYDPYLTDFWLHLEVNGQATLEDIDRYLRGIWLECCGHLSMFTSGGWRGEELNMSRTVDSIFKSHEALEHIYDFGTSSHTMVAVKTKRKGQPLTKHPIYLMARNNSPVAPCVDCGEPATYLCYECLYENKDAPFVCKKHLNKHLKHSDGYGEPVELANSPRMGMCGYNGPSVPPY